MRVLGVVVFGATVFFFAATSCGGYFRGSSTVDTLPRSERPCLPSDDAGVAPRDATLDRLAAAR